MDGWMDVGAELRIAYSNKKQSLLFIKINLFDIFIVGNESISSQFDSHHFCYSEVTSLSDVEKNKYKSTSTLFK